MAERRMFAKTIIDSDAFIDMPVTSRLLYYDLAMRADDDGFVNSPKKIMRMIGAQNDDLNVLIAKKFIIPFETGVVVIKHWKIHNYIQKDRYKPTKYEDEKAQLTVKDNGAYSMDTDCIQDVYISDTQVRLGKDRLGKDRLDTIEDSPTCQEIIDAFNETCVSYPKVKTLSESRKKAIKARLKTYSNLDVLKVFELAEESDFLKGANNRNWSANFDWIMKDSNFAKILDGNYNNKEPRQHKSSNWSVPPSDYIVDQINGVPYEGKKASKEAIERVKKLQAEYKVGQE